MYTGPHIKRDGLVFGYDTGYSATGKNLSKGRHFKGPASSNILEVLNHSLSNASDANRFVLNGEEIVNIPKVGKRSVKYTEYYNNHSNAGSLGCCPNLFYYHSGYITGVESSTPYTYSIIYKHTGGYTHPNFMYRYEYQTNGTYNTEGGLHSTASDRRTHLGNGWYHAWGTFTTRSTTTQLRCYSFLYNYGTTKHKFYVAAISLVKNTSGSTHLIIPPQLMLKPNTSISSTQSLIDLTKTTNIDVSNVSFDSTGQPTFDGTDDRIDATHNVALDIPTNITVEAVVKYSAQGGGGEPYGVITYKGYPWNWLLEDQGGKFNFRISTSAVSDSNINSNFSHGLNTYHHVVATYNGTTQAIYVNGVLKASKSLTGSITKTATTVRVGSYTNGDYVHNGDIPIVKIYNRALSANEVKQNFRAYKNRFNI